MLGFAFVLWAAHSAALADEPLPEPPAGWRIELVKRAPEIVFPTAIAVAPDGVIYLGQDPMDMPGPPTQPIDSIVAIKDGKVGVFADKLWAVMGLEWISGTLYVVHAPYLSALTDTDGDGKADRRVDLVTGLGPRQPGFNGINDHVPSGMRLGIDGYLYIAIGDKGVPHARARDGSEITLKGGGVIRVKPDGSRLEVVSTGERNPLSVALTDTDEIFTYGNDDDSKLWPNSLTHHIVGGHYGYPYEFLAASWRTLPIVTGLIGGSGTQAICYNESRLPKSYDGNLFVCDWGLQRVDRIQVERSGATFKLKSREAFVTKGKLDDFRPFSLAVGSDGASFYLVDWAYSGWLADGPRTGRLYRMSMELAEGAPAEASRRAGSPIEELGRDELSVRMRAQRDLAATAGSRLEECAKILKDREDSRRGVHVVWALDSAGTRSARGLIREALRSGAPAVRVQAIRSSGMAKDGEAFEALIAALDDADAVARREAAIALGKLGDRRAGKPLLERIGDSDRFVAWSMRKAIRDLGAWDESELTAALVDPKRRDSALVLCDESWSQPAIRALARSLQATRDAGLRARIVACLAGQYLKYPAWSGAWFGTNPLAGAQPAKTQTWDAQGMAAVLRGLAMGLEDPDGSVRREAIVGLRPAGNEAIRLLHPKLAAETDPRAQEVLIRALTDLYDVDAVPGFEKLLLDPKAPASVRSEALAGLEFLNGAPSLKARMKLVFDERAPAPLVAKALGPLGLGGFIPANDLLGFVYHKDVSVRIAAIGVLNFKNPKWARTIKPALLDCLGDADPRVRGAACAAAGRLGVREAIPKLAGLAKNEDTRRQALAALCLMPDPSAVSLYISGLGERDAAVRKACRDALAKLGDRATEAIQSRILEPSATKDELDALERLRAKFAPISNWRVIGPFPRTTAQVFIGERAIDFSKKHVGAEGKTIVWRERKADPATGKVSLDDFKSGQGDRGGFGYDVNGSPDLCSFGYAEIEAPDDREALFLIGSSGTCEITVNEMPVYQYGDFAGRGYSPDTDLVRATLTKGVNRVLVKTRQGIGAWAFGIRVSGPVVRSSQSLARKMSVAELESFVLSHKGDPVRGEALFFDANGIGCVKCHSVGAKGSATIGPNLAGLALKYDAKEIVKSVLEPSERIATGYQPVVLALRNGTVVTGVLRAETEAELEIADAEAKVMKIAGREIEERKVGSVSIMPTGLADRLSPNEVADLTEYLKGLKTAPAGPANVESAK